jgi:hypothetical protein
MMTMSRAISAGQALDYYQQEFTNAKDNYYSEAGEVKGRWSGRLADKWELKGEVKKRAVRAISCWSRSAYWRAACAFSKGTRNR